MDYSERFQRLGAYFNCCHIDDDKIFAERILNLLNHPELDKHCLVDAYYYDYSVIPDKITQENDFCRDMYLLYGITNQGQIVSKWVKRYDLDSDEPIIDGKIKR